MSITTQRLAAIRRAENEAQSQIRKLDRNALNEVDVIYREAAISLRALIVEAADPTGNLVIEVLRPLLAHIEQLMESVGQQRDAVLNDSLENAVQIGANIMRAESAIIGTGLSVAASDALEFMVTFTSEDGLQLSDRLWRLNQGAVKTVGDILKQAIIQGTNASQAADALLSANVGNVAAQASDALIKGEGSPRANALRVMRTEINRAHGEAYRNAIFEHPDIIGTKFNLSPNHPRKDICDMHARVNRYGLGRGVYPKGRSPWPAHPNTMSYETAVFADEVSKEDRAGKEDRISWLKRQSKATQISVLGKGKADYLDSGDLSERMIRSRLRDVQKRVKKTT